MNNHLVGIARTPHISMLFVHAALSERKYCPETEIGFTVAQLLCPFEGGFPDGEGF